MAGPPTTSFALLGLLVRSPKSGYDLASLVERSIANFWPVARSQVYGELARLDSLGYVRGSDVAQERLPDKRVYEITPEGVAALDAWLAHPGVPAGRFRSGLLVKVFFADRMTPEQVVELLAAERTLMRARRERLAAVVNRLEFVPTAVGARLTALHGLGHAEASLRWLDEAEAALLSPGDTG